MNNYQNRQNETPNANCMDVNFEQKIEAQVMYPLLLRMLGY